MKVNNLSGFDNSLALATARALVELCVLQRLSQDTVDELYQIERLRNKCHLEFLTINSHYNNIRVRMNRRIETPGARQWFDETVNWLVDKNSDNVEWVQNMLKASAVQYIPYNMVEPAVKLGFAGGIILVMREIGKKVRDRNIEDYNRIHECFESMERKMGICTLNGVEPDITGCHDCIMRMFERICEDVRSCVCEGAEAC